ncbi:hypothetical protein [Pedobacter glucosidilyticus]|uniref:hypothetical protein n=1 Tax=Pedobacter glucosidilyticus TaxID=1122941 RepID=UPI000418B11E|nr:hypothetical protein [Pedobacter glucosidilyticus]
MMKYKFLILIFSIVNYTFGQSKNESGNISITSNKTATKVSIQDNGELLVNVSPQDLQKIKSKAFVSYSDFGAVGDGKTDDIDAIAATHAFANQYQIPVKVDGKSKYYISGKGRTAIIQTNTDFGDASFMIDDTQVQNRNLPVFMVSSTLKSFKLKGITSLQKNQEKIDVSLNGPHLVTVSNATVKQYIRFGANQNSGKAQTDIFIVDKHGYVDAKAPIIWDFNTITDMTALPMDSTTLTLKGGHFTTMANKENSKYSYYSRGISIRRSNVVVEGLEHRIIGEGETGAPYGGFINIGDCANVTVKNTLLTGHKVYKTIGAAGVPVSMGTYDLSVNKALNVSFINCSQTNDINDSNYWGILGSNYSKNLLYDGCSFSRFDAHMGVANATIRNSKLGHQGINAIGSGKFIVENSTIYSRHLINLRPDYGSTWEGEFIIRNCTFAPSNVKMASLIGGSYSGQHDFGYTCYMPEKITIENLRIDDTKSPLDYEGPAIFANFNPKMKDESYQEKFPYVKTKEVNIKNLNILSGKPLRVSDNTFMFKDVKVNKQ